jgi:hypothetical protein
MSARMRSTCRAALAAALVFLGGCGGDSRSTAPAGRTPDPIVTGPVVAGYGRPNGGLGYDVTEYGYVVQEYFFEGTARAYGSTASPAPYRTRMIVWTPADRQRYNGTTVVEWAEVSVGIELAPEINFQSDMFISEGYAFALVSTQEEGVASLKSNDAERYGPLIHPGDAYSFDVFSQALQAIRHPRGLAPLGGLRTDILIAAGFQVMDRFGPDALNSASPALLNGYIHNGADADARLADAFLVDTGAALDRSFRYRVPTLHHLSEDWVTVAPVPDSANHVTWEAAGAPHADRYAIAHSSPPSSTAPLRTRQEEEAFHDSLDNYGQDLDPGAAVCAPQPGASSVFPRRFGVKAATAALREWLRSGIPASPSPPIERNVAFTRPEPKFRRDADGNAIGGLRSPVMDVPVAVYNGETCGIFGTTSPLLLTRLAELYPTHERYVRQLAAAVDDAVTRRQLLCQDAATIMRKASASTVGGSDPFVTAPACVAGATP